MSKRDFRRLPRRQPKRPDFSTGTTSTKSSTSTTRHTIEAESPKEKGHAVDIAAVKEVLANQTIEVPSWAYGNSGTRFKVFGSLGTPRDPFEKLSDAA